MFRFTIRELILLTIIVAMGVAWRVDRRRLSADVAEWKASSDKYVQALRGEGWFIHGRQETTAERNERYRALAESPTSATLKLHAS